MVCHQISSHIVFDRLKSEIKISISSLDKEEKRIEYYAKRIFFFLTSRESTPDPRKNRIVPRLCAALRYHYRFHEHLTRTFSWGPTENIQAQPHTDPEIRIIFK